MMNHRHILREFYQLCFSPFQYLILVSIVVSIPACHAGDRGSIPRRGDSFFAFNAKFREILSNIEFKHIFSK